MQKDYIDLQLKYQNQKQCIDTSRASNAIFEINKLRDQLRGKEDTIRNLEAQTNIMKVLNAGPTVGSFDKQALETELTQLKDVVTSLRIKNDGYKVDNTKLNRLYLELSTANTHLRTKTSEKIAALTAEIAKFKPSSSGPRSTVTPKVLAPGMYAINTKYIVPPKRDNWVKPTPLPKKKQVTFEAPPRPSPKPTQTTLVQPNKKPNVCVPLSTGIKPTSGASKPVRKSVPRNHRTLLATREKVMRVEEHPRNLNKKNRVDSHLNAKRFVSISNLNTVCGACNEHLFSNKISVRIFVIKR